MKLVENLSKSEDRKGFMTLRRFCLPLKGEKRTFAAIMNYAVAENPDVAYWKGL